MATAIVAGSLLASGASAVAGASTVIGAGITLGKVAAASSVLAGAASALQGYQASRNAAKAEEMSSREKARELRLQRQKEQTQSAIEEAERERTARRLQASQRASVAGKAELSSGTPMLLQDQAAGQINREQRLADLSTDITISAINRQSQSALRAGANSANALRASATTSLLSSASQVAQNVGDLKDIKKPKIEGAS